jgi:hypothetical protein
MSRFKHPPPSPPDVAGIVKEAIGEYLARRARTELLATTPLGSLGIRTYADYEKILTIAEQLDDAASAVLRDFALPPDAPIETVGDLIDLIQRAYSSVGIPSAPAGAP